MTDPAPLAGHPRVAGSSPSPDAPGSDAPGSGASGPGASGDAGGPAAGLSAGLSAAERRRRCWRRVAPAAVRFLAGLVTGVLILLVLGAAPAQAAGYRYWSFWKWSGSGWAYQQQGPAVHVPPDGAVEGWRFAVSPDGGQEAARPGTPGDFAAVCGATPEQSGRKRVAVVLDFGTPADAPARETPPEPRTACAVVSARATSAEVLATVAPPLRYDGNGLLCAIAGYPRTGCGEQLGNADRPSAAGTTPVGGSGNAAGSGSGTDSHDDASSGIGGPDLGVIADVALIALLVAGAVHQTRRRR
ncbi:SCO2322 family protein [Kitasatospora sp. NPDC058406]|uniref:SCO2322 family protein n=1 Tax=Kitasatospora sp. NPDC058406 TaxID=3346483 RepID=UPI0036589F32